MYCSLDKIDLAATVDGQHVAIQTDHRSHAEISREPELSTLYALARVLNARHHLAELAADSAARGGVPPGEKDPNASEVHYVVAEQPPEALVAALRAAGATLITQGEADLVIARAGLVGLVDARDPTTVAELADRAFAGLARRAATRIGTRDLAIALRMLEDETLAAPPSPADEPAYWRRVLELAALTGELLRSRSMHGHWVQTDRALVPFGFQVAAATTGSTAVMFPTNRAQRMIEDGRDQSLFKLLMAADEAVQRPAAGRLMPSLRRRDHVELDEVVWTPLVAQVDDGSSARELPVLVCGIDGETTFGMMRREALDRPAEDAIAEALANLAGEDVQRERLRVAGVAVVAISGSFYAAEKLLDRAFMRELEAELGDVLAAAVPARGLLLVTAVDDTTDGLARFAALVARHHAAAGARAISRAVLLVEDGEVTGYVAATVTARVTAGHDAPDRG